MITQLSHDNSRGRRILHEIGELEEVGVGKYGGDKEVGKYPLIV